MRPERLGLWAPIVVTDGARDQARRYEAAKLASDRIELARAERDLVAELVAIVDPLRSVEIDGIAYWYGPDPHRDLYRRVTPRRAAPPAEEPEPESGPPPGLLTKREAAELLGIPASSFSGSCFKHGISPVYYGGVRMTAYYTRDQVEKVREKRKAGPAAFAKGVAVG